MTNRIVEEKMLRKYIRSDIILTYIKSIAEFKFPEKTRDEFEKITENTIKTFRKAKEQQ